MILAATFLLGVAYSLLVTRLWQAVHRNAAWQAAGLDLAVGILAAAPFQLWMVSGWQPAVLGAEVLGSAVGTFWGVRTVR